MARIGVIAGDGVGKEVTEVALQVLRAVDKSHQLGLELDVLDYGADRYLRDGVSLPEGEMDRFRAEYDAIFLGALGDPRIPDMRHGREILLAMRFELDLFINLRPVRCLSDALNPLKGKSAADVDFVVFRENTEGPYVGMGGNFKKGTADEVAITEDVNTRKGVERIIRAAFRYAMEHGRKSVIMTDKSNALVAAHGLWRRVFEEVRTDYPDLESYAMYVDALVMEMVRRPEMFDVIVTNNLFGDIITDLGAALQGGMGMAASANIHPGRVSLFEPVHGSAPDIAGQGTANPIASVLTVELMMRHLGHREVADAIDHSVRRTIEAGILTPDVGGTASTGEVGAAIIKALPPEVSS